MSDPFLPQYSNQRFVREAWIGLLVLLSSMAALGGWWYTKYRADRRYIPEHVRQAPIARHVDPEYHLTRLMDAETSALTNSTPIRPDLSPPVADSSSQRGSLSQDEIEMPSESIFSQPAPQVASRAIPTKTGQSTEVIPQSGSEPQTDSAQKELVEQDSRNRLLSITLSPNPNAINRTKDLASEWLNSKVNIANDQPEVSSKGTNNRRSFDANNSSADYLPATPQAIQQAAGIEVDREGEEEVEEENGKNTIDNFSITAPFKRMPDLSKPQLDDERPEIGETYATVRGDSFWLIASQNYNDGRYFRALYEFNRNLQESNRGIRLGFDDLPAGTTIVIPSADSLREKHPDFCPADSTDVRGRTYATLGYTTKAGDTLFSIARQQLEQASRYLEILELNRDRLPDDVNHLTRLAGDLELWLPLR